MKRVLAIVLILLFVLSAAACGNSESDSGDGKDSGKNSTTEKTDTKEKKEEKVELTKETAKEFLENFYRALVKGDIDAIYEAAFPEDRLEYIREEYGAETNAELKDKLRRDLETDEEYKDLTFTILAVSDIRDAKDVWQIYNDKVGDPTNEELQAMYDDVVDHIESIGTKYPKGDPICVAAVRWSATIEGEYYEEMDLVSVYIYKGKLYIGSIYCEEWF